MDHADALERWLRALSSHGAADLFLVAGFAPAVRVNGVVTALPEPALEGDAIEAAANHMMTLSDLAYFYAGLAFGITFVQYGEARRSGR